MLLDPKVYVCSRTGADKVGYLAKAGDIVHEFLSDDSEYDIYINGHTVKVERDYVLQDGDMINAIHRPAGVEAYIAVTVIVSLITIATLPKPEKPNTQGTQSTSPNNQVSGQTNIARTGEGIPDIKGTIRAYPDLIQSSWYTWEDNRRRVRERFCAGVASLDITSIQDNDVSFDDITGSSATVVERAVQTGDVYPVISDLVTDARLEAENERVVGLDYVYLANDSGVNYIILHSKPESDIVALLDLNNESSFTLSGTGKAEIDKTFTIDKTEVILLRDEIVSVYGAPVQKTIEKGCYRIPVVVASDFPLYDNGSCTDYQVFPDPVVSCFPDFIVNGWEQNKQSPSSLPVGALSVGVATDGFTTWSLLKNADATYDWYINLLFPAGLVLKNGGRETIDFRIQARDSVTEAAASFTPYVDGSPLTGGSDVVVPVRGQSRGELGVTIRIAQTKPNAANNIEFRIRRDSDINLSASSSYAKIETVYCINQYPLDSLGDGFTLIDVDAKSDFTNKTQSSRKINMLAARKQYSATKIGGVGDWYITYGSSFNSFADAVLSDFVDLFDGYGLLDMDSLYENLNHVPSELKEFNYSYDDADISLGQRIATACNAARVGAYRDGQVWRFYREESKPVTFHFDRRNIAGNAESQMSFRFQKPNDHDSVRLSYIDPSDNKERHIERKINVGLGTFETGIGERPLEIDLAGCRNTTQAVNRAELEVRRLVYQRRTVSERVLSDGLLVDIGDRVRWACIYDNDIVDAEVLGFTSDDFTVSLTLSEKPRLPDNVTKYMHVTDVNGDVHGPYVATLDPQNEFDIRVTKPTDIESHLFVANNMPAQLGSRVIIGTTENLDYYDFTVTSKTPNTDGTVQIEMIEYNELMFSED